MTHPRRPPDGRAGGFRWRRGRQAEYSPERSGQPQSTPHTPNPPLSTPAPSRRRSAVASGNDPNSCRFTSTTGEGKSARINRKSGTTQDVVVPAGPPHPLIHVTAGSKSASHSRSNSRRRSYGTGPPVVADQNNQSGAADHDENRTGARATPRQPIEVNRIDGRRHLDPGRIHIPDLGACATPASPRTQPAPRQMGEITDTPTPDI